MKKIPNYAQIKFEQCLENNIVCRTLTSPHNNYCRLKSSPASEITTKRPRRFPQPSSFEKLVEVDGT